MALHGGSLIDIPANAPKGHPLEQFLRPAAFKRLRDHFGGGTLRIPTGAEMDRLRLIRAVAALVRRGLQMNEVADTLDMKLVSLRGYIAQARILGFLEDKRSQGRDAKNAIAAAGSGNSSSIRVPDLEQRKFLERLRDYIERNWKDGFIPWDQAGDVNALDTVGFRRDVQISVGAGQSAPGTEFYITAKGWKEVFRGLGSRSAGQVLLDCGVLVPGDWMRAGKREQRPYTMVTPPMLSRRQCYHVRAGVVDLLGDMREAADERKVST